LIHGSRSLLNGMIFSARYQNSLGKAQTAQRFSRGFCPHFQPSDRRSIRFRRMRSSLGSRLGEAQIRTKSPVRKVRLVMPSLSSREVLTHFDGINFRPAEDVTTHDANPRVRVLVLELDDVAFDFDGVLLDVVHRERVVSQHRTIEYSHTTKHERPTRTHHESFHSVDHSCAYAHLTLTLVQSFRQFQQIGLRHGSVRLGRMNENVALEVQAQAVEILKECRNRRTDDLPRPRHVEVRREQNPFLGQVGL
jgi:hypothetical protein